MDFVKTLWSGTVAGHQIEIAQRFETVDTVLHGSFVVEGLRFCSFDGAERPYREIRAYLLEHGRLDLVEHGSPFLASSIRNT